MDFEYRVIWINPIKNKQEWCDVNNQNIAIFIAKKKVREGMGDVIIQVSGRYSSGSEQDTVDALNENN